MPKIVDHAARRTEISAAAVSLIAKGGMDAATIREIAQASGYSKGVVEHYFENKEELISGALASINAHYEYRITHNTAGLDGIDALRKRLQLTLPLNKTIRDEWKVRLVFWSMAAVQNDLRKAQEQRFERAADVFEQDILRAVSIGELQIYRPAAELARHLFTGVAGVSVVALQSRNRFTRRFLLAEIDTMIAQLGHQCGDQIK
jgi:AcrR family transcriptional regulator